MMTDHLQESDSFAFNDEGERVPVVWPKDHEAVANAGLLDDDDAARVRQETINRFLGWIISGDQGAESIGRRCLVLAYSLKLESGPRSLEDLADRLGVSKTRAWQIADALKLNGENGLFVGK